MDVIFANNTSITNVEFDDNQSLIEVEYTTESSEVEFDSVTSSMDMEFGTIYTVTEEIDVEAYDGEYEVTPKVTKQTLPTAQKFLARDVTVEKIPYFEVSNNSGGMTASIGEV